MKRCIITCIIVAIAIMGTKLLAQGASNTKTVDDQAVPELTKATIEPQLTPRPLEMYDADGYKKYYVSGSYRYTYIGAGKGIRLERFSEDSPLNQAKKVVIPSELDGYPVRRIAGNSFSLNPYVEEVTIPDSVEVIGDQAFSMCKSLKSVHIGKNVRKIDNDAFYMCKKLEKVSGGESLRVLRLRAFQYCRALKDIPFYNSKYKIATYDGVFSATGLSKLTIHKNMRVSGSMFKGCKQLKTVKWKYYEEWWTDSVFENCTSLKKVILPKNMKEIQERSFYNCRKLTSVNIPNKVKWIGPKAFGNCKSLNKLKLPKSINKIEKNAFRGCKKLTLYVKKGSYAHNYAKKHHIKYKYYK